MDIPEPEMILLIGIPASGKSTFYRQRFAETHCGGISAVAESLVLGNSLRLYLPLDDKMYFFQIDDREAIRRELLVMLRHIIRTIQCHIRWQKKGLAPAAPSPYDPEEIAAPEISPYGTTVSCLQKQCREIERELGL